MALRAPEGTRDLLPDEQRFWTHFKQTAADIFGRYGYQPIETPLFEQTDLFVRGIGEATDVVSKEMFSVKARRVWCARWCKTTWFRRGRLPPS